MKIGARLALLLVFSGGCMCGPSFWRPTHRLRRAESVPCGSQVVLDGLRQVWSSWGCEDPTTDWHRHGDATEQEIARVEAAFARLPPPESFCSPGLGAEEERYYLDLETWETRTDWTACAAADGGIAVPFDEAIAAMKALGSPY